MTRVADIEHFSRKINLAEIMDWMVCFVKVCFLLSPKFGQTEKRFLLYKWANNGMFCLVFPKYGGVAIDTYIYIYIHTCAYLYKLELPTCLHLIYSSLDTIAHLAHQAKNRVAISHGHSACSRGPAFKESLTGQKAPKGPTNSEKSQESVQMSQNDPGLPV